VCSWLVRFEPTADAPNPTTIFARINFHSPILGFAFDESHLDDTELLAIDGVNYASGGVGPTDSFSVSGTTLSALLVSGGLDQFRVITAC